MSDNRTVFFDYHISTAILDTMADARKDITIVSPYVQLWGHMENALTAAKKRGVKRTLYLRSEDEKQKSKSKINLAELEKYFDQIIFVKNLHAKLYFIDDEIIMSSMNLYNFSQASSREIAIRLVDPVQKAEVEKYLAEQLVPEEPTKLQKGAKMAAKGAKTAAKGVKAASKAIGFIKNTIENAAADDPGTCLRCGDDIDFNPEKPFCGPCYKKWNKYSNPMFTEKYCHNCGRPAKTSLAKPECITCFKAN